MKTNAPELQRIIRRFRADLRKASPRFVNRVTEIVKAEIHSSIMDGCLITGGSRSARLKKSTIKAKGKKRTQYGKPIPASKSPDIPLADTWRMKNVVITKQATSGKLISIIKPHKSRARLPRTGFNLARHHQEGKFGPWFGISPNARKRAGILLKEAFKPIIARFNRS